jgi:hypothetical protein
MTSHALVHRQPDVVSFLNDIKALDHKASSTGWDRYDIVRTQHFNDWWKENLAGRSVSGMLPKSSVQDVMELVEDFFSELVSHGKSCYIPDLKPFPIGRPHEDQHSAVYDDDPRPAQCRQFNGSSPILRDSDWERIIGDVARQDGDL